MENWYYSVDGPEIGPVTKDEIIRLINSGEITDETLLRTEEFTKWKKLTEIKDAFFVPVTLEKNLSSALALTSMILGILSFICFGPFSAIPALILGIIALVKIKKGIAGGKGFAITGIITSVTNISLLIVFAISLFPEIGGARKYPRRISCASNLKSISIALRQYALDYDGYFPPYDDAAGLEILRKNSYLDDYKIYTCPSTDTKIPLSGQPLREENVSYHYKGGYTEKDSSDLAILWDKDGNHTKYGNILFLDGHVMGYSGADWKKNIRSK
ncbi:MAG: hypothetical protein A2017_14305 [Lentisphaerae bacterium GWF2_44_16]|nr:MAG: hypothetical protein A2017_14305 [Lentisphaerae bacterium GWF2_44_16]